MHPLYETKDLTDDDILDKLNKSYEYLSQQQQLGHNTAVSSIEMIIDTLEMERNSRFYNQMQSDYNKLNPDELKPIEIGKLYPNEQDKK